MADASPNGLAARLDDADVWRALHVLGVLVLVAVVVPFVVFTAPQVVGAEESYVVLSGSMAPAMSPGDVILVDAVAPSAIETGDVITYSRQAEATPTTHRVVEVVDRGGEPAFRTKGDANEDPDSALVPADAVIGQVMTVGGVLVVIPAIGYVIEFASTSLGFALLVVVPVALLAVSDAWYIVTSTRNPRSGRDASGGRTSNRGAPATRSSSRPMRRDGPDRTGEPAEDEDALTLLPRELRLGVVVLVAFAAYALWWAVEEPNPWTIGVAAMVGMAALLLGGLYLFGGTVAEVTGTDGEGPASKTADQHRRSGRIEGGGTDD